MFKRNMTLLAALLVIAGTNNAFAGKTVRNSADDGDARRRARKAWEVEGTKGAANRAVQGTTQRQQAAENAAQKSQAAVAIAAAQQANYQN